MPHFPASSPRQGVHASACPSVHRVAASPRRRFGFSPRAFTLFELVLVLAIIAIVVGVTTLSLSGFVQGRELADTATRFIAVTRYARTQAVCQATVYRLNIDPQQNRWWLTRADDSGTNFVVADSTGDSDATLSDKLQIDCAFPLQAGTQVIDFEPGGKTDPGTITLRGPRGGSIQITCDSPFDVYHVVPKGGTP
jgi:type II secretion system protein H